MRRPKVFLMLAKTNSRRVYPGNTAGAEGQEKEEEETKKTMQVRRVDASDRQIQVMPTKQEIQ